MYISTPGSPLSLSPITFLAWGPQASRWNLSATSLRNLVLWFIAWNTVPGYSQGFLPFFRCLLKNINCSEEASRTDESKIAALWLYPFLFSSWPIPTWQWIKCLSAYFSCHRGGRQNEGCHCLIMCHLCYWKPNEQSLNKYFNWIFNWMNIAIFRVL